MERYSDKAIEIINELHTERLDYTSEYIPLIDAAQQLSAYEDTGLTPDEVKQMRWIPVEERLPKPEFAGQQRGFYLVAFSNGTVKELMYEFRHYENMMFDIGWHETAHPVTHWMALPKAPKEENQ